MIVLPVEVKVSLALAVQVPQVIVEFVILTIPFAPDVKVPVVVTFKLLVLKVPAVNVIVAVLFRLLVTSWKVPPEPLNVTGCTKVNPPVLIFCVPDVPLKVIAPVPEVAIADINVKLPYMFMAYEARAKVGEYVAPIHVILSQV